MATRYVDLINGNDANNGTTFALRKKTLNSASTGLTGGDTIRIMKTTDATSLGNCTWSNSTSTITLPGAVTAHINTCESGWTASTNVTVTYPSGTGDPKYGSVITQCAIAAGFTTGKVAYAPCATVDLSSYQQISLFFRNSAAIAANILYIDLCSDSTGDVPVVSFAIPAHAGAHSQYISPYTFNYGANLPSNINSIAIRATTDPGTINLMFEHIIACKDATVDTTVTLNSLIGLNTENEPEWFPIKSINGTALELDISGTWRGTSGSQTTYKLQPLLAQNLLTTLPVGNNNTEITGWNMNSGGSITAGFLNIEFGWDTTDMSTQNGYTAIDAQVYSGRGLPSGQDYIHVNKFICIRNNVNVPSLLGTAPNNVSFGEVHFIENQTSGFNGTSSYLSFDKLFITSAINFSNSITERVIGNLYSIKYLTNRSSADFISYIYPRFLNIKTINASGIWPSFGFINDGLIDNMYSDHTGNLTDIGINLVNPISELRIKNLNLLKSSMTNAFRLDGVGEINISVGKLIPSGSISSLFSSSANQTEQRIFVQDYNNTGVPFGKFEYGALTTTTTGTHSGSGSAWEFTVAGNVIKPYNRTDYYKVQNFKIADIPVKANKLHTISVWVKRAFTATKGCLYVRPSVLGVDDYVISETAGSANTWEQLTITFTPTSNGVAEIFGAGQYDNANASQKYTFDDLSVTIAD